MTNRASTINQFTERSENNDQRTKITVIQPSPVPTENTPLDEIAESGEQYYPWLLQHREIIVHNAELASRNVFDRLKARLKVKRIRSNLKKWCDEHIG